MPAQESAPWRIPPDELVRPAAPVSLPGAAGSAATSSVEAHHGASDARRQARQRADRDRSRRAMGAGKGRSYAFRRS